MKKQVGDLSCIDNDVRSGKISDAGLVLIGIVQARTIAFPVE
jgi:hypothetical protein